MLAQQAGRSATVMAYADSLWILGICIATSLLARVILRNPRPGAEAAADAH